MIKRSFPVHQDDEEEDKEEDKEEKDGKEKGDNNLDLVRALKDSKL